MTERYSGRLIPPRFQSSYQALLASRALTDEGGTDFTLLYLDGDTVTACGSLRKNVIVQVAVAAEHEGEGWMASLVSELCNEAYRSGIFHLFLYTKPENGRLFGSLGFSVVAETESMLFLESPKGGMDRFLSSLPQHDGNNGCVVCNCDPMTNGHLRLLQHAAAHCDHLYVFVLSDDGSFFPPTTRFSFVEAAMRPYPNVTVAFSEDYLVSRATFPTYFLKKDVGLRAADDLDLAIFTQRIAPRLSIRTRFMGSEPFDAGTAAYNRRMQELLPQYGISVSVTERTDGISASRVRALLKEGNVAAAEPLLPPHVYEYCTRHFG